MTRREKIQYLASLVKAGWESFDETYSRLKNELKKRNEQFPEYLIYKAVFRIRKRMPRKVPGKWSNKYYK